MEYLEKLNAKLVEVKKEIDNFEKNISELKEKYPEISAYELATKSNVNEYIEKIVEIGKKQILLQSKKSEYEKLNNEKTILEENNKKANDNEFVDNINKIISKHGILKWRDLTTLICSISVLQECDFLIEEDKNKIKLKIDNRIAENNELINQINIKINEPKVSMSNMVIIKNSTKSVVAKGKESTINSMKSDFENSIGKITKHAKNIYQRFCESQRKKIQNYLNCTVENINKNVNKLKETNDLDNGFLNQRLSDLERNFELQEEAKRLNDKNKIVKIKDMYKQLIESNNPEQKEKQFISI